MAVVVAMTITASEIDVNLFIEARTVHWGHLTLGKVGRDETQPPFGGGGI